jgi:sulfur transfer complex TusBCD TusB component (DsrH family)
MNTLIMIGRAHSDTAFKLASELQINCSEVHILFMGRGTHYLSKLDTLKELEFAKLYTFETEFDSPKDQITAIGYEEFVKLIEKCERTFTWI